MAKKKPLYVPSELFSKHFRLLRLIHEADKPVYKAKAARLLGVSIYTVMAITEDLARMGIIEEVKEGGQKHIEITPLWGGWVAELCKLMRGAEEKTRAPKVHDDDRSHTVTHGSVNYDVDGRAPPASIEPEPPARVHRMQGRRDDIGDT